LSPERYAPWLLERLAEVFRVLVPGGSLVLNINDRVSGKPIVKGGSRARYPYVFEVVLGAVRDLGFLYANPYWWRKPNAMPGKRRGRTKDALEWCLHLVKPGADWYFDLEAVKVDGNLAEREYRLELGKRRPESGHHTTPSGYTTTGRTTTRHPEKVDPGNVLTIGLGRNHKRGNPATFPHELPEWFILAMSQPGETVLDPFLGSGTTGEVAVAMGRRFEGVELSREGFAEAIQYVQASCERVREEGVRDRW